MMVAGLRWREGNEESGFKIYFGNRLGSICELSELRGKRKRGEIKAGLPYTAMQDVHV